MRFIALLMSVLLVFTLVACAGNNNPETSEEPGEPIEVENGLFIKMPESGSLRIAQFADLHFGTEGKPYQNDKEERTKAFVKYVAENGKPDLIVCSGDNIMSTGVEEMKEFVKMMDELKTPWTYIYGNHDAEMNTAGFAKKDLSNYLESCGSEYLIYSAGYVEEASNRYGNFSISVLNNSGTKLLGALMLFDAGVYAAAVKDYETITAGQIDWYKQEIDKLNEKYDGEMMPSIVFSHIQLPEFHEAYLKASEGNGAEFVIKQELDAEKINGIKNDGPVNVNSGFYDVLVEKGSTKAYLVGHAHFLNFQVKMDGIVLGFAPQTGFSTLFENNDLPRTTYIYNLKSDFSFTTETITEPGDNIGLTYWGSYDGTGVKDEASGLYKAELKLTAGNSLMFAYNGVRLKLADITIEGDIAENPLKADGEKLYPANDITLKFAGGKARTFYFSYNPETKTLNISSEAVQVDPNAPKSVVAKSVDKDAGADAIAVWTEAGAKLREVTNKFNGTYKWVGNGWRYYIVVDAEGRIAYAVQWPESGYGGPNSDSYYCNEFYSDYTQNPAIKLYNGYKDDWASGGFGYKLYDIVVPEGGFAITSHGETNNTLIDMISQGMVNNYDIANINNRTIYDNSIRLSFDKATNTISVSTVE